MKSLLVIKLQGNQNTLTIRVKLLLLCQLWKLWDISALPFIQMIMRTMACCDGVMLSAVIQLELLTPPFEPKEETGSDIIVSHCKHMRLNSLGIEDVFFKHDKENRDQHHVGTVDGVPSATWMMANDYMIKLIIWCDLKLWLHCGFFAPFSQYFWCSSSTFWKELKVPSWLCGPISFCWAALHLASLYWLAAQRQVSLSSSLRSF